MFISKVLSEDQEKKNWNLKYLKVFKMKHLHTGCTLDHQWNAHNRAFCFCIAHYSVTTVVP